MGIWSRKPLGGDDEAGSELDRRLMLAALVLMGIGGTIGAGIPVHTRTAAGNYAGPGVAIPFAIARLGCLFAALYHAELASMIPVSDSARRHRGFRAPALPFVATGGVLTCGYMMVSLPADTWTRFAFWLALGLAVYFLYSARRSRLATAT